MTRRWYTLIILAIIGTASVILLKDLSQSPTGTLYYLGKAIHNHDAGLFAKYVDYEAILGQMEAPSASGASNNVFVKHALQGLDKSAEGFISRLIEDESRPNLPNSYALLMNATIGDPNESGQVEVVLQDFSSSYQGRLSFTMLKYPDETWRVAMINLQDLEWLALNYFGLVK